MSGPRTGQNAQTHPTKYRKFSLWQKIYSPFKATASYCRYTGHVFLKVPILPCSSRSNSSPVYLFHFFHRIPRLNSLPVVILMSSISPILTRSFLGWDVWIFQQPRLMEQNMSSISSFRPGGLDFPLVSVHGN